MNCIGERRVIVIYLQGTIVQNHQESGMVNW